MKNGFIGLICLIAGLILMGEVNLIAGGLVSLIGFVFMFRYLMVSRSLKKRDENNVKNPWNDSFLPPNK